LGVATKAFIGDHAVIGPATAVAVETMLTVKGVASSIGSGPNMTSYITADQYPLFQINNVAHDNIQMSFDAYTNASGVYSSSVAATSANFRIWKSGGTLIFDCAGGFAVGAAITTTVTGMMMDANGNIGFFGAGSFGGGLKVMFIANRTTAPSSNPVGGGILFSENGALKYRGSSGTPTTIAAA
jgi:hypothetical protein